jgi:hypothetical protein
MDENPKITPIISKAGPQYNRNELSFDMQKFYTESSSIDIEMGVI